MLVRFGNGYLKGMGSNHFRTLFDYLAGSCNLPHSITDSLHGPFS